MCRAQGLAHQKVTTPQELTPALAAARGLNKHSVVEVVTSRETNVRNHLDIQEAVRRAVGSALADRVGEPPSCGPCCGEHAKPLRSRVGPPERALEDVLWRLMAMPATVARQHIVAVSHNSADGREKLVLQSSGAEEVSKQGPLS